MKSLLHNTQHNPADVAGEKVLSPIEHYNLKLRPEGEPLVNNLEELGQAIDRYKKGERVNAEGWKELEKKIYEEINRLNKKYA